MTTELKHLINSIKYIDKITEDLIIIIKKECICEYVSKSACLEDLGYKTNDFIDFIEIIHPSDRELATKFIEIIFKNDNGNEELRFKHKNRSWRYVEAYGSNLMEYKGAQGIIVNTRDFTDRKMAEERLKESEEKLKKLNKELESRIELRTHQLKESELKLREQNIQLKRLDQLKNDFITIAAHELKTPLSSVIGYADLIQEQFKNIEPEMKDYLIRMQNNAKRLETYINHIIDVMKIDAKKMDLRLEIVNINKVINDCISDFKYQIELKNLQIKVIIPQDLEMKLDSFRILEVFSNLISNAIKFTPESGKIDINVEKLINHYIFRIKDTGQGLTQDQIKQLFEKFVMLNRNAEEYKEGSGLGLYITKGLVEAHGGTIGVKSEGIGKGSEFFFTLPIH